MGPIDVVPGERVVKSASKSLYVVNLFVVVTEREEERGSVFG